ncbi:hypothetical protein DFH06DRAFT_1024992, partial [Mycena polygramma]
MTIAKAAAAGTNGETPPAKKFWRSTRDKDISRSIRFFLWMLLHGAYKVGQFWDNIPSCVQRGKCARFGVHESMEHILTQCCEPGQKEIWDLAQGFATHAARYQTDTIALLNVCHTACTHAYQIASTPLVAGGVMKCGDPGTTRLHKILITESAHLIWRIRNEQVIQ